MKSAAQIVVYVALVFLIFSTARLVNHIDDFIVGGTLFTILTNGK